MNPPGDFKLCFQKIVSSARELATSLADARPIRCSPQTQRDNTPAETEEEYYRRAVTIPMLDHLIAQMETRFSTLQRTAAKSLNLIPSVYLSKKKDARAAILTFAEEYAEDMPDSYVNGSSLEGELDSWEVRKFGVSLSPLSLFLSLTLFLSLSFSLSLSHSLSHTHLLHLFLDPLTSFFASPCAFLIWVCVMITKCLLALC